MSWFDLFCRDLPWRFPPDFTDIRTRAWSVLVSEVMLQQTPVARVLPVFGPWMQRWPTPGRLAEAATADVIRAWGRLGYPRRAMRLQAAAAAIDQHHDGLVPSDETALRALPGVGEYTAGAVRAFAYDLPALTLDTNVRRVFARYCNGEALPAPQLKTAERDQAWALMPAVDGARWMAALMELGALVCTAKDPKCEHCPLVDTCAWVTAGRPAPVHPVRRQPKYEGSDRQVRGKILKLLRDNTKAIPRSSLDIVWPDPDQLQRALTGLVSDGLVDARPDGTYQLPSTQPHGR